MVRSRTNQLEAPLKKVEAALRPKLAPVECEKDKALKIPGVELKVESYSYAWLSELRIV